MTDAHAHPAAGLLAERTQLPAAIVAAVALGAGFALHVMAAPPLTTVGLTLIWVSLALGCIHAVPAAWSAVRRFQPDIDVLMVVGAGLAAGIGHPEEGALLLVLFNLAHALEHRALDRAKDAVSRLNRLMPKAALRRVNEAWQPTDPEELAAGDVVLVRPGETVPADGIVVSGASDLDQSTLTGESLPRSVGVDDEVFAGTMNQQGALEVQVTRPVQESSLHRILELVLEAQERRQPVQRVIDRFSTPYTVSVFVAAFLVLLGFLTLGRMQWSDAVYRAITLLVVASPCALVIATPTATLCGLSRAARAGVLIKGGDALERLAGVSRVVLDKTGTLTQGQIEVMQVTPIAASNEDVLLRVASAVEARSTHPIAAAIVRLAERRMLRAADVAAIENMPGKGIEGEFDGQRVRIGSLEFCEPIIPVCFRPHTKTIVEEIRSDGGLPVVVAHDHSAMVLAMADQPRDGAKELRSKLARVGVGEVGMLTGDHPVIARRLADELGIDFVEAQLLPEQKVQHIERIRATGRGGGSLAVVGDGVNDAPALAVADVGLAMGHIGADAALETADVILLHDDLDRIPWSFGLARRVRNIMVANLAFATLVIVVLGVWTIVNGMPLSLGVLGHEGSTLLVVANSLRLLAHRAP